MATVFAERERERRGLTDEVDLLTGGTDPADEIHGVVRDAMAEVGADLSDRQPREVTTADLESCDYVATMGCSTLELEADEAAVDVRDWALEDPDGKDPDRVREVRETVRERVRGLFDEVEAEVTADA